MAQRYPQSWVSFMKDLDGEAGCALWDAAGAQD